MNNADWGQGWPVAPASNNERDYKANPLSQDERDKMLMDWDALKKKIEEAKQIELEFRKIVVKACFPEAKEGMNTQDLGNGYQLKAGVKFNYVLSDNETVEKCLDEIAAIGNEGAFIAERIVSWKPNFLLTEYRTLQEAVEKKETTAIKVMSVINKMLTITDAAPTLDIKEPKSKRK